MEWEFTPQSPYTPQIIAGPEGMKGERGSVTIAVDDLPRNLLPDWMRVNPRLPRQSKISQAIQQTLRLEPEKMLDRNLGIWVSADKVAVRTDKLTIVLTNPKRHGILNGGNTYLSCTKVMAELAAENKSLANAYVTLHIRTGLNDHTAVEMAESLNKTGQLKEASLLNKKGYFAPIQRAMQGHPGFDDICYYEGDTGRIPVTQIVNVVNAFDLTEYDEDTHPLDYARSGKALQFYQQGCDKRPSPVKLACSCLPDILRIMNRLEKMVPEEWERDGSRFHHVAKNLSKSGSATKRRIFLPFLGEEAVKYEVPFGMIYPWIAAFRANVDVEKYRAGVFQWNVNPDDLLDKVIGTLVKRYKSIYNSAKGHNGNIFTITTRDNSATMMVMYAAVADAVKNWREPRARKIA